MWQAYCLLLGQIHDRAGNTMSNVEQNTTNATEQASQAGVSRRKLMRAGLSAAPVLAVLKSNSVLAANTGVIAVSTFASLQNTVAGGRSCQPYENKDYSCYTPAQCANDDDYKNKKVSGLDDCSFGNDDTEVYGRKEVGKDDYRDTKDKLKNFTVKELCGSSFDSDNGLSKLARNCIAAHISAKKASNSKPVWLSTGHVTEIWSNCSDGGIWQSPTGYKFDRTKINTYMDNCFNKVYKENYCKNT